MVWIVGPWSPPEAGDGMATPLGEPIARLEDAVPERSIAVGKRLSLGLDGELQQQAAASWAGEKVLGRES